MPIYFYKAVKYCQHSVMLSQITLEYRGRKHCTVFLWKTRDTRGISHIAHECAVGARMYQWEPALRAGGLTFIPLMACGHEWNVLLGGWEAKTWCLSLKTLRLCLITRTGDCAWPNLCLSMCGPAKCQWSFPRANLSTGWSSACWSLEQVSLRSSLSKWAQPPDAHCVCGPARPAARPLASAAHPLLPAGIPSYLINVPLHFLIFSQNAWLVSCGSLCTLVPGEAEVWELG